MTATVDGQHSQNALDLDFERIRIHDLDSHHLLETLPDDAQADPSRDLEPSPPGVDNSELREKIRPYVNPDRVKSGGIQRVSGFAFGELILIAH